MLQSFGTGGWFELLWSLVVCSFGVFCARTLALLQKNRLLSLVLYVVLPPCALIVSWVTLGDRYPVVYMREEALELDGVFLGDAITLGHAEIQRVGYLVRNHGEEYEVTFVTTGDERHRLALINGRDTELRRRLELLIEHLEASGIEVDRRSVSSSDD